jgi:hypothetical protein
MPIEHFCKDCGKKLEENERPCSKCGCSSRNSFAYLEDNVPIPEDSMKGKLKRPGIPGVAYKVTQRNKTSGKTKRPTKETLIFDRTHPENTVKDHKVWEKDGEKWMLCHDEHEVSKAKHRTKK